MKPSLPKGTRDFLPEASVRRQYLFGVISSVFRRYGYAPIETPAMENLSTLTGKYGEEGDRLLFRILNNGDFLSNADADALSRGDSNAFAPSIARRGMRYDLTVPFARFVVMHQNDIPFPFKRYQIQPVWRADRPQKGRYQEFYQCDVDVVGSKSLLYEAELVQIYDDVFHALNLPVTIRINHRKILTGIAEYCNIGDKVTSMTSAIDKWDKIGEAGVRLEMEKRGIAPQDIDQVIGILLQKSLDNVADMLVTSTTAMRGIEEIRQVFRFLESTALQNMVSFDVRLARGLDYYTGCIFEVEAVNAEMGSLGGGGRYDDLTAVFGMQGSPGVGVSFGAERIYDVMETMKLFPESLTSAPQLLFVALNDEALAIAFATATALRKKNIAVDVYPEPAKLQKQMRYANDLKVPLVAIVGEDELKTRTVTLKDMTTGEQKNIALEDLAEIIR